MAVAAMATYWFENLFTTLPSSSVSTLSMTRPVTKQDVKEINKDHVAMYMPSCTQAWGAPFLSVRSNAYMRVVTNKMESMGANARVDLVASIAVNKAHFSIGIVPPVISEMVSMPVI